MASICWSSMTSLLNWLGFSSVSGQIDLECSAIARFTVDVDEAVVLLDNAVDRSQPKTGPQANSFLAML